LQEQVGSFDFLRKIGVKGRKGAAKMSLKLGDVAPEFVADSTIGKIDFHKYIDGSWAILFSHPNDFTPVCTTELGAVGVNLPEFEKRGVKVGTSLLCFNRDLYNMSRIGSFL
jgi:peroxiredoxin